jgi:DNA-binding response OmpR family regulator
MSAEGFSAVVRITDASGRVRCVCDRCGDLSNRELALARSLLLKVHEVGPLVLLDDGTILPQLGLTPVEAQVLALLIVRYPRPFTQREAMQLGYTSDWLRVFVSRIRPKLHERCPSVTIHTIKEQGYALEVDGI